MAITVDGDKQIVFFLRDCLLGVAARTGELRWRYPWPIQSGINAATPVVFQTRKAKKVRQFVFISSGYEKGCALVAIMHKPGGGYEAREVFNTNRFSSHYGTPVRVGDHIYGFNENVLVCMSLRNGEVKWEKKGYKKGSLLAVGDKLLVLGEEGNLALLKADPHAPVVVVAEASRVMTPKCWTMPVLADGRLLLRGGETIRCLDFKER